MSKMLKLLLAGCLFLTCCATSNSNKTEGTAPANLVLVPKDIYQKSTSGIFAVVIPNVEDTFIKYEKDLPYDKLPFHMRNDKFRDIGTAFLIGNNKFVSAA